MMGRSGRGHVNGPLAGCAEEFRAYLLGQGYAWGSAAKQIHLMAHLSRWLDEGGAEPRELTATGLREFFADRRRAGHVRFVSMGAAEPLWSFLRAAMVVVDEVLGGQPDSDVLLVGFERYLTRERSLSPASVRSYLGVARRFLGDPEIVELRLESVSAAAVSGFARRECARRSVGSAKVTVTGLRAFLQFAYLAGRVSTLLTAAVPSVASWQLAALPRTVSSKEMTALLSSCDRRRALGRRDFAVLTLLARLGLRAEEVACLELGDIDWRAGDVLVRGKGARQERLPLPADVGQAIAAWLQRGRPRGSVSSTIFVCLRAPHRRMTSSTVSAVVRRACARAGMEEFGSHRLRHTAASRMLTAGGSLAEIGQILRHSRLQTTAVYAKVDGHSLGALAMPWPGALS